MIAKQETHMTSKSMLAVLLSMIATVTNAHPGHPAISSQHAHTVFGIDSMYALLLTAIGAAGGVLVVVRRRWVRSRAK